MKISIECSRERPQPCARLHKSRVIAVAAGALGLAATLMAVPASAATSGSNSSTVNLAPPVVRSLTVSPATATFGNCTGPNGSGVSSNPSVIAFPNGVCSVGVPTSPSGITGGITITNGTVAGHIDVNGQPATPADTGGTPWTIGTTAGLPGVNQFLEQNEGSQISTNTNNVAAVSTTPACDTAFTVAGTTGDCTASAGQASNEALNIMGPTSSTDQNGPFTVTTTWTAVP